MKIEFKAHRLDVQAFAEAAGQLQGETLLADLPRLREVMHLPSDALHASPKAHWQVSGEVRKPRSSTPQVWVHLVVDAEVPLECQRCLKTVQTHMDFERWYRFASDEAQAAALDAEEDDDVLVLSRNFDLITLIEDELLLDLPVVPRHEGSCPQPLPMPADDPAAAEDAPDEKPNPFAALAQLRSRDQNDR